MTAIFRWNLIFGLGAIFLAVFLLFFDVPFMRTWFYICAWWPLILVLDSVNFRMNGWSPLSRSLRDIVFAAFISVPVWLVFELFNLRLQNWSYHSLPPELPLRWLGYGLAFASVIPALLEFSALFENVFKEKRIPFPRLKTTKSTLNGWMALGVILLVFCLVLPRLFFPFLWLGFLFLMGPVNFRLKLDSLLADANKRQGNRILSWLLAGLAAGVFWEALNYWAGSHWEYTIPYLNFGRIFQMPLFGYGGFLPFALEVFAIYTFLSFLRRKAQARPILQAVSIALILAFDILSFYLIDTFTLVRGA